MSRNSSKCIGCGLMVGMDKVSYVFDEAGEIEVVCRECATGKEWGYGNQENYKEEDEENKTHEVLEL